MKSNKTPIIAALGTTVAISLSASPFASAADNPFSIADLVNGGYMVAEGKCGEGKCGDSKAEEGKCGEGKCGDSKAEEGKCGGSKS